MLIWWSLIVKILQKIFKTPLIFAPCGPPIDLADSCAAHGWLKLESPGLQHGSVVWQVEILQHWYWPTLAFQYLGLRLYLFHSSNWTCSTLLTFVQNFWLPKKPKHLWGGDTKRSPLKFLTLGKGEVGVKK